MKTPTLVLLSTFLAVMHCQSQGFVNLNFENPIFPFTTFEVPMDQALPGWSGYRSGNPGEGPGPVGYVVYNTISYGGSAISLQGPGSTHPPIDGNYSAFLQRSFGGTYSIALFQTGQIPTTAKSLMFLGSSILNVSFSGTVLPTYIFGSSPGYELLGTDVSAFAGLTGELRFEIPSAPGVLYGSTFLDNIRFSPVPIPEPTTGLLFLIGAGVLVAGRRRA